MFQGKSRAFLEQYANTLGLAPRGFKSLLAPDVPVFFKRYSRLSSPYRSARRSFNNSCDVGMNPCIGSFPESDYIAHIDIRRVSAEAICRYGRASKDEIFYVSSKGAYFLFYYLKGLDSCPANWALEQWGGYNDDYVNIWIPWEDRHLMRLLLTITNPVWEQCSIDQHNYYSNLGFFESLFAPHKEFYPNIENRNQMNRIFSEILGYL